jgi:alginate O-acetyltransferase complex protein AlgI
MSYNSIIFIFVFMPLVVLLNYVIKKEYRVIFLILASLLFYAYTDWGLTKSFMAFILITYFFGQILKFLGYNKLLFGIGIVALVIYLFYFKYLNFFTTNLNSIFGSSIPVVNRIAFPLGVSFFTFSAISYLIDSFNEKKTANFLDYVHYITFFPKLVSGPIVRLSDFNASTPGLNDISVGSSRFIVGLAKKVTLAYYFGLVADSVWKNFPFGIDVPTAWIGATAYTLQIYFDFSGYTDMAIGVGKMLGYSIPENFDFPYSATSITEYWKRWHKTLGRWLVRYVYIPLGGSRKGNVYFNLLVVFLISGLWHGANWTFILWGLWHALFRILEQKIEPTRFYQKIPSTIKWIITLIIVVFSRAIYRSVDINQAIQYFGLMLGIGRHSSENIILSWTYFLNKRTLLIGLIGIYGSTMFGKSKIYAWWKSLEEVDSPVQNIVQTVLLAGLATVSVMMILSSEYVPFIYFTF